MGTVLSAFFILWFRLTIDHPKVGKLFPFGGKNLSYDQLKADKDVRAHGKRVMETVGHAVNGLDDLDLLVPILAGSWKASCWLQSTEITFRSKYTSSKHCHLQRIKKSYDGSWKSKNFRNTF